MDKGAIGRPTVVGRPEVLKKLNAESLLAIERGLLGDLPEKLRPPPKVQPRGRPQDLVLTKQPSNTLLSSCLPIVPDSPGSDPGKLKSGEDEVSPLKKTFSFRDKFSRMNFFGREKSPKYKWKIGTEPEMKGGSMTDSSAPKCEQEKKRRLWFFKQRDGDKIKSPSTEKKYFAADKKPIYKRSKSFEFLPRAAEDEDCLPSVVDKAKHKSYTKNRLSYMFGSSESISEAWLSSESFEELQKYKILNMSKTESFKYLENAKERGPGSTASSKSCTSSASTAITSNNSGLLDNLLQTESVQNLFYEFDKAVEMFSENYSSDCEPYTKDTKVKFDIAVQEHRKSRSFSTLPSPKIVHVKCTTASELSETFSKELNKMLSDMRKDRGVETPRSARRGSVTDWSVLEEPPVQTQTQSHLQDKYRRAQKKPINRIRRISSTKYQVLAPTTPASAPAPVVHHHDEWITPEECAVFGREPRPPLVIPRISHHRARAPRQHQPFNYTQESPHELRGAKPRQYGLREWSPQMQRPSAPGDSPVFTPPNKRLGGSTENLLLVAAARRPGHLPLPASSSDSLDVDVRDRAAGGGRNRKSRSMVVAAKQRVRSPVPAPRLLLRPDVGETPVHEGPVKRTKFAESGKKVRKHWTDCYMILTQTALKCYKDQKTYEATKSPRPAGTPPSPTAPRAELELPLKNGHIMRCNHQHTSRYARSLILTVGYSQYLIQDETVEGSNRWLELIQDTIYQLGPSTKPAEYSPYQSSNTDLESLGRTPPAVRNPSRVKQKDEPAFGSSLERVCPTTPPRVPKFVVRCVEEIERSEENMCTDGLYRASGNLSQVQKIRLEIDQNNWSIIENNPDIHVLTGSLKLFFRELKEPLIPCKFFDRVLAACSIKPREARTKEFREIVRALPACNRDTLKFLLEHLLRVTTYSEKNRMHTANLAIVFGPTLLWAPAEQAHNIALDCIQQNNVVDILLTDFDEIFAEDTGKNKKKA